jgi:hypothetical protein
MGPAPKAEVRLAIQSMRVGSSGSDFAIRVSFKMSNDHQCTLQCITVLLN